MLELLSLDELSVEIFILLIESIGGGCVPNSSIFTELGVLFGSITPLKLKFAIGLALSSLDNLLLLTRFLTLVKKED